MDQRLLDLAKQMTHQHLRYLRDRRNKKKLFKRVNDQGKVYGRSFQEKSRVYQHCIQHEIYFIEWVDKKGDDKKYMNALHKIFFPCDDRCKEKSCPYCVFQVEPTVDVSTNLQLLFHPLSTLKHPHWKRLKLENNFAPTKKILMMLSQSKEFMAQLYSTTPTKKRESLHKKEDEHVSVFSIEKKVGYQPYYYWNPSLSLTSNRWIMNPMYGTMTRSFMTIIQKLFIRK